MDRLLSFARLRRFFARKRGTLSVTQSGKHFVAPGNGGIEGRNDAFNIVAGGIFPQQDFEGRKIADKVLLHRPEDYFRPGAFIISRPVKVPLPFSYRQIYRELARVADVLISLRRALRQKHQAAGDKRAEKRAKHGIQRCPVHNISSRKRVVWCNHFTRRGRRWATKPTTPPETEPGGGDKDAA